MGSMTKTIPTIIMRTPAILGKIALNWFDRFDRLAVDMSTSLEKLFNKGIITPIIKNGIPAPKENTSIKIAELITVSPAAIANTVIKYIKAQGAANIAKPKPIRYEVT